MSVPENCMDCPHHLVVLDPDPHDWFNDDDEAVLCRKSVNDEGATAYASEQEFPFKPVTVSCRPYQKRQECERPDWCPLLKEEACATQK